MVIVEMEAPFSQINFEKVSSPIVQGPLHIISSYPSPSRSPKIIILECTKVVRCIQRPELFTMWRNHNIALAHRLRLLHRPTAYSIEQGVQFDVVTIISSELAMFTPLHMLWKTFHQTVKARGSAD